MYSPCVLVGLVKIVWVFWPVLRECHSLFLNFYARAVPLWYNCREFWIEREVIYA